MFTTQEAEQSDAGEISLKIHNGKNVEQGRKRKMNRGDPRGRDEKPPAKSPPAGGGAAGGKGEKPRQVEDTPGEIDAGQRLGGGRSQLADNSFFDGKRWGGALAPHTICSFFSVAIVLAVLHLPRPFFLIPRF